MLMEAFKGFYSSTNLWRLCRHSTSSNRSIIFGPISLTDQSKSKMVKLSVRRWGNRALSKLACVWSSEQRAFCKFFNKIKLVGEQMLIANIP